MHDTAGAYGVTTQTIGIQSAGTVAPVGQWKLDETSGTVDSDSSSAHDNGTLVNSPTWTAGKVNNALSFNGSNQSVSIPDSSALQFAGDMSMAFWIKVAVTLDAPVNAKKKTGPVALTVNQAKLDGTKMTLALVQTIPGKFSSETTTTTYQFPLTQDTTLTGTFSRDHAIPSPLGSAKVHDDGTVGLTKLPG